MHLVDALRLYDVIIGTVSFLGVAYLFARFRSDHIYHRFLSVLVVGLFIFTVVAPVVGWLAHGWVHLAHGVAALLVIFGLYDPVRNDLRHEEWTQLVLRDPRIIRRPIDWMVPMDDEILELFHSVDLVLTPSIIAYNTGYSREEVNRRLSVLTDRSFVTRVERGKYRITDRGEDYLAGRT